MLTPDITTLWVIGFLLLCTYLLNTLVFKPILRIIDERSHAVRSAKELAESAAQKATSAAAEYDQKLNAARAEVYQQMDSMRKTALDKRADVLAATRTTVEQELAGAHSLSSVRGYLDFLLTPRVIAGFGMIGLASLVMFKALSLERFSVVIPTAVGINFVLTAIVGVAWFSERITTQSFAGLALILAGITLLGLSR